METRRAAGYARDRTARISVPVRRAQPDERGHYVHAERVAHLFGVLLRFRRGAHQTKLVAQPLHDCAAHKHASFQSILRSVRHARRKRRNKPVLACNGIVARISKHKTTRAERVFRRAAIEATLTEQRGLLIARNAGNGHARAEHARVRVPEHPTRRQDARKHALGYAEQFKQFVVPVERVDIKQHGARRVGVVGRKNLARRQFPH